MSTELVHPEKPETPARICVPIRENSVDAIPAAIDRAVSLGADLVEIRLDFLRDDQIAEGAKSAHSLPLSIPPVLTIRPVGQGGKSQLDLDCRIAAWLSVDTPAHTLFDWELDIVEWLAAMNDGVSWERIICSYHDFGPPGEHLDQIFERMLATPAGFLKLAITARDTVDCFRIFGYLKRARALGRKMIALAMGPPGLMSRVLGPAFGSVWTYAASDHDHATADGQLSIETMVKTYRTKSVDAETLGFGIIGNPVAHSLSPVIHGAALSAAGINSFFLPLETLDPIQFLKGLNSTFTGVLEWRGMSVTAPHKATVLPHLDWLDPAASEIGAVNTIVVEEKKLFGYNTDAAGFLEPLRARLIDLRGLRCAVLGAGGAARAVVWALNQRGANVTVFAREPSRARALGQHFKVPVQELGGTSFGGFDLVVNTTPLGTTGAYEDETPAVEEQLRGVQLVYDLVYNPESTRFLQEGEQAGARAIGGLEMLLAQAAAQFRLWTGGEPDLDLMRSVARENLASRT